MRAHGVVVAPPVDGDISSRADVHDLVVDFYREIIFDELLGPIFEEVAEVDWAVHIPNLIDYWSRILLGIPGSALRVTEVHRHLHGQQPLTIEHCDRWFELWTATLDARWSGPIVERARNHAASIMAGMARHIFDVQWAPPEVAA
ncbi:MAG TPA: group III truncated hemoglobin [Microthrixaceae bacterium]|jgi:hemoglobin|nr:group III truncated hemoglobin [Microthrixaceae bacterium]